MTREDILQPPPITPPSVLGVGEEEEEEYLDVVSTGNASFIGNTNSLDDDDDDDDTMPFLQMLQLHPSELPIPAAFAPSPPTFQMLLSLQHHKLPSHPPHPFHNNYFPHPDPFILQNALDPGETCCLTHHDVHPHSPVTFETRDPTRPRCVSPCGTHHEPLPPPASGNKYYSYTQPKPARVVILQPDRKKRKRAAAATTRRGREKGDVESQRMTHIVVERNRRRLMNDHLRSLRSLMPPSYAQRGDQASIVGGAIDFVKELEQLVESLEAQKRYMRRRWRRRRNSATNLNLKQVPSNDIIAEEAASTSMEELDEVDNNGYCNSDYNNKNQVESKTGKEEEEEGDAKVRVVAMMEKHVNLKVECICGGGGSKRKLPLVRAIIALEQLNLTVLHLNITTTTTTTTSPTTTLHRYSFSLKMEDECMLKSGEEIVEAVHQIFG